MFKKRTFVFLILSVLLSQAIIMQTSLSGTTYSSLSGSTAKVSIQPITEAITTDAVAGTELVQTNHFPLGDMETTETNGEPEAFYGSGTGTSVANFTYQDEVYSGTYGAYMSTESTTQYSANLIRQRMFLTDITERAYIDEDITLDFWFNPKANPDFAFGAEMYFTIMFSTNIGNHYIHYYLSRVSGIPINGSTTAFFDLRSSLDTWTNVARNISEDFTSVFSSGPDYSASYCYQMQFSITSVTNPLGSTILLFDDMSVTNGTGFNYFADNGDFENGDAYPWYNLKNGPASLYTTAIDKTEGTSSMNLTLTDLPGTETSSDITATQSIYDGWQTIPKGYYAGAPGDLSFSFDWKYSDTVASGGDQNGYFYLYAANATFSSYFYFILGTENDLLTGFSNQTFSNVGYYSLTVDGFGTRDTWHEFNIDFFMLLSEFGLTNLSPYYIQFRIEVISSDGCTNQLLVDDFQITTYPASDPGFEGNFFYNPADPILYWITPYDQNYVNITMDARTGNYAANVTVYTGSTITTCYRDTYLPVTTNLYTDFSWRLDKMTSIANPANSEIRLEISDSRTIHYVLGANQYFNPTNDSDDCYYLVDNYNITDTWFTIFRNLYIDVIVAFGVSDWAVTNIELRNYAVALEVSSTVFDDINFVTDITGPVLSNLNQTPDLVEWNETVTISVDVTDLSAINFVELYYQINSEPYTNIPMTNTGGDNFEAIIPTQEYGTVVTYYVFAIDIYSQVTTSMIPYDFTVTDLTDPNLSVEHPSELEDLSGTALFNITADDPGSGIASCEITIDGISVYDQATVPATYEWNTNDYTNGQHSIVFLVTDNAANEYWIGYSYTIYNEPAPTNVGAIFGGLVSFGLVAIASSTMIYFSERRKKYLKRR